MFETSSIQSNMICLASGKTAVLDLIQRKPGKPCIQKGVAEVETLGKPRTLGIRWAWF